MGKRCFDLAVSAVGLAFLAPLLFAIAVLIKWTSDGPVLYRGVRTGRFGKPFRMFKFRTMVADAERLGGPSTGKDDPRITAVGRVLRRRKLDELPQLINVLRGEMSVVGPRPEVPRYTAEYSDVEKIILTVRPGITDYASLEFADLGAVLGNDEPDKVYETRVKPVKNALRVRYVEERSFVGDLRIIVRTVLRVFRASPSNASAVGYNTKHDSRIHP